MNLQGQNISGTPIQGAALQLVRGVVYTFDLTAVPSFHPFIITSSSVGATSSGGFSVASFGSSLAFTPDANTPSQLYYQCTNHASMGGTITIVDPPPPPSSFYISTAAKNSSHPWFGQGFANGYVVRASFPSTAFLGSDSFVNTNVPGGRLVLNRGQTYTFTMLNVNAVHPLIITESVTGSPNATAWLRGVTNSGAFGNQTLTFTPDGSTPNTLYYQCAIHLRMGGQIDIVPAFSSFYVSTAAKNATHPYFNQGFSAGYVLRASFENTLFIGTQSVLNSSVPGGQLVLTRGQTYTFTMLNVNSVHPFIITESAIGTSTATPWLIGVNNSNAFGNQTLTFTPDSSTPNLLYYQCAVHAQMGADITIIDPPTPSTTTITTTSTSTRTATATTTTTTTGNPPPLGQGTCSLMSICVLNVSP